MPKNDYSAGMVSKPFWFIEFKVMTLLDKGVNYDEIKRISLEENLFGVPEIIGQIEDNLQMIAWLYLAKAGFLPLLYLVS